MLTFKEVLAQVMDWLQQDGRVSYRALTRQFDLDDSYLDDLKEAILFSCPQASDEQGRGLGWMGDPVEPRQGRHADPGAENRFYGLLRVVILLLQHERRVTYRELKHVFALDEGIVQELRHELILKQLALDEGDEVLVWTGDSLITSQPTVFSEESPIDSLSDKSVVVPEPARSTPEAERRQLTVMFCDLVGSTDLSGKLDPEDLREVVRAYQETAAEVIHRYEGHIAQYLGDGLLIYFGFPVAHEDDAQRAIYTGVGIPEAMADLNVRLQSDYGVELAVRIGIHTGPVVVGEMGGGGRHENLALGETPNIAARLEGLAQANTAVISPVTAQLVQRSFVLEELGPHELKGVADPMMLYSVVSPREVDHDDYAEMLGGGLETLVGRDEEIGLLLRRWEQSKEGQGQVVLISGEAGLGKSSLVEGLRAHVQQEGFTRMAFRCSPYTENSALHPVIEHVQQALDWQREDSAETRLSKLEQGLSGHQFPSEETVPLLASLLSLALPEDRYPPLSLTPQQQRQHTHDTLVAWMLEEAERHPVLSVWEDLHWADPSTLELLGQLIDEVPTVSMMTVVAFRPMFAPSWPNQSHLTPITLNRLERLHTETLVMRLAGGKALPHELVQHVVTRTDGVPLYVEELTKMLLESDLLEETPEAYVLTGPLSSATIPATLQDSLMARLDRLPEVREVAQLGSVLGREFAYEMLEALRVVEEQTLQAGLTQLVQHELLYQRGRIPRAKYIFRHALIRDAAYQSLLRRTRQQVHEQVAQLIEARFPEVVETQPELVAHHYREAGCAERAVMYWQEAGQRAIEHWANQEAVRHLTMGLEVIATLPDTPAHCEQELNLLTTLRPVLSVIKGSTAPEIEPIVERMRALSQQVDNTPQLAQVLRSVWSFYLSRGAIQTAQEVAEQLFRLAQNQTDTSELSRSHLNLGISLLHLGELITARDHFEQGLACYDPDQHRSHMSRAIHDARVLALYRLSITLWFLGYPDQALARIREAIARADALSHVTGQTTATRCAGMVCLLRRDVSQTLTYATRALELASEHPNPSEREMGTILRGWALVVQGDVRDGLEQMHNGLAGLKAVNFERELTANLAYLADAHAMAGQPEEGLNVIARGLEVVARNGERVFEAELYRIKGELLRQQSSYDAAEVSEAESCFHQSLEIARQQEAKSWELRTATSLARLWQSQGKRQDAYDLLSPVFAWFTEGFDTADLQDAQALLDELRA